MNCAALGFNFISVSHTFSLEHKIAIKLFLKTKLLKVELEYFKVDVPFHETRQLGWLLK